MNPNRQIYLLDPMLFHVKHQSDPKHLTKSFIFIATSDTNKDLKREAKGTTITQQNHAIHRHIGTSPTYTSTTWPTRQSPSLQVWAHLSGVRILQTYLLHFTSNNWVYCQQQAVPEGTTQAWVSWVSTRSLISNSPIWSNDVLCTWTSNWP